MKTVNERSRLLLSLTAVAVFHLFENRYKSEHPTIYPLDIDANIASNIDAIDGKALRPTLIVATINAQNTMTIATILAKNRGN